MENKTELKLLRPRSLAAVISDGYRLYMGSFRSLFRSSWPVAIGYAAAFALLMGNVVNNVIPMVVALNMGDVPALPTPAYLSVAFMLLYMVAAALLAAQAVGIFGEHSATDDVARPQHWYGRLCLKPFLRLLAVGLWMLVLVAAIGALFYLLATAILALGVVGSLWKSVATIALFALVALMVAVLCVPLQYTVMRALLDGDKVRVAPPASGYALGLRNCGLLLATAVVVCILTGLLTLVCELPAVIMAAANTIAYVGVALGDPLGMPANIVPLTYAVFFVAGFIQAYVHLSTLYPMYYAYGSIEEMKRVKNLDTGVI